MPHLLKNKYLEVKIDLPLENYQSSRFDWTGKITEVTFQGIPISGVETHQSLPGHHYGQGFYNEFGMDSLPGFPEAKIGDWCHKIGVGLVRKEGEVYYFNKEYEVRPATFQVREAHDKLTLRCQAESVNGYSYRLDKQIELLDSGFLIRYQLSNTGIKPLHTTEYTHNFLSIGGGAIGKNDLLSFPAPINPDGFDEMVNPQEVVNVGPSGFSFKDSPEQPFFFRNISGGASVPALWFLQNKEHNVGISERGSFPTRSINLWGWKEVISPELFVEITLESGEAQSWWRRYEIFTID